MIRDEFKVHLLNPEGLDKATRLAQAFSVCLDIVEEIVGDVQEGGAIVASGRDMAIVRTKLQEASFFAKRAMACRRVNQQEPDPKGTVNSDAPASWVK